MINLYSRGFFANGYVAIKADGKAACDNSTKTMAQVVRVINYKTKQVIREKQAVAA